MPNKKEMAGADENTPSLAQYFSWINNTNEGATEAQTLVNLDFFAFLHREYGMILDIYAFDAGALDGPRNYYGKFDTEKFKRQFPNGWKNIAEKAKTFGARLGLWGGPDGFGNTEEDAQARIDLISGLCRDYQLALLKFDGVCGTLRPEKQDYFVKMMQECRKYSPNLILLNHRLDYGKGNPYATTNLMEGRETYVDVLMSNQITGTHNRIENISRNVPPKLSRLQEDHGVCLSSCMDFWDDDLILQAFNRGLILAPEIYGNPWLLRDDEFPKLARIYNLFRRNREILIHAQVLDEQKYGPHAVSRGDSATKFITLRNLTWNPVKYTITLNQEIGLQPQSGAIAVRQFHPTEKILGQFAYNISLEIEVEPFRSCLITVSALDNDSHATINNEIGVIGTDYEIINDLPDKPVKMILKGMPGTFTKIQLHSLKRAFSRGELDGQPIDLKKLMDGTIEIDFPGSPLKEQYHRKIADLEPCDLPTDAEALYEITCYAATNNCLEVRELERSGPTHIPEVQAARDAFFNQHLLKARGVWDRYAFDGDDSTRWFCPAFEGAALRIDFGELLTLDSLVIKGSEDDFGDSKEFTADISADLKDWQNIKAVIKDCHAGVPPEPREKIYYNTPEPPNIPFDPQNDPRFFGESRFPVPVGDQKYVELDLRSKEIRFIRSHQTPLYVLEINGKTNGQWVADRSKWRGSHIFTHLKNRPLRKAWKSEFVLSEISKGSYLCVALNGQHGLEGAYAAMKVDGALVGAPRRAPSYPGMPWEHSIQTSEKNNTYYIPLSTGVVGKKCEVFVLSLQGAPTNFQPEVWITTYPTPFETKKLILA
jgi:hypothetical protein